MKTKVRVYALDASNCFASCTSFEIPKARSVSEIGTTCQGALSILPAVVITFNGYHRCCYFFANMNVLWIKRNLLYYLYDYLLGKSESVLYVEA